MFLWIKLSVKYLAILPGDNWNSECRVQPTLIKWTAPAERASTHFDCFHLSTCLTNGESSYHLEKNLVLGLFLDVFKFCNGIIIIEHWFYLIKSPRIATFFVNFFLKKSHYPLMILTLLFNDNEILSVSWTKSFSVKSNLKII